MTIKKSMGKPLTEAEKAEAAAKFGAAAGTPPSETAEIIATPSKSSKRKQRFNLYLTDAEHDDLKAAAELEDRSQHDFTRRVVLAEVRRILGKS